MAGLKRGIVLRVSSLMDTLIGSYALDAPDDLTGETFLAYVKAAAEKINDDSADGWTVDMPGSLGSIVRHSQIRLDEREFAAAWALAESHFWGDASATLIYQAS